MQIGPQVLPVSPFSDQNRGAPARPQQVEPDREQQRSAGAPVQQPDRSSEDRPSARVEAETARPTEEVGAGRSSVFERTVASEQQLPRGRQQALQAFDEISQFGGNEQNGALVGVDIRV